MSLKISFLFFSILFFSLLSFSIPPTLPPARDVSDSAKLLIVDVRPIFKKLSINIDYDLLEYLKNKHLTPNTKLTSDLAADYCQEYSKKFKISILNKFSLKNDNLSFDFLCVQQNFIFKAFINNSTSFADLDYVIQNLFQMHFLAIDGNAFYNNLANVDNLESSIEKMKTIKKGESFILSFLKIPYKYQADLFLFFCLSAFVLSIINVYVLFE